MGKLAVYRYFSLMFLIATIVVMLFTFAGLLGGRVDPVGNTAMAMLVYILPILIILNVLLLIYWIIRRRWIYIALPIIPILCSIPYMGTLFQLRSQPSNVDNIKGLKIASYNVQVFGRETTGFKAEDILAELEADAAVMQENTGSAAPSPAEKPVDMMGSLFDNSLSDKLLALDVMTMTPLEAMNELYKLQAQAKREAGQA
jgi:ABC-type transport system involved in multi-copper enzyme maturation permease subunit